MQRDAWPAALFLYPPASATRPLRASCSWEWQQAMLNSSAIFSPSLISLGLSLRTHTQRSNTQHTTWWLDTAGWVGMLSALWPPLLCFTYLQAPAGRVAPQSAADSWVSCAEQHCAGCSLPACLPVLSLQNMLT